MPDTNFDHDWLPSRNGWASSDQRGVSPVIGVILMVAITVILAAIIASFVLSFPSSLGDSVSAGADITVEKEANGTADVTWVSGGNAEHLNVTVDKGSNAETVQLTEIGQIADIEENSSVSGVTTSNGDIQVEKAGDGNTEFTIVVLAGKGDSQAVIQKEDVTI